MLRQEMECLDICYEVLEKGQSQKGGLVEDSTPPFSPIIDVASINGIPSVFFSREFLDIIEEFIIERDCDALWD